MTDDQLIAASPGNYVTDGKRLAEVLGIDNDGNYHLEDASADADDETGRFVVEPSVLARDWEPVRHE